MVIFILAAIVFSLFAWGLWQLRKQDQEDF